MTIRWGGGTMEGNWGWIEAEPHNICMYQNIIIEPIINMLTKENNGQRIIQNEKKNLWTKSHKFILLIKSIYSKNVCRNSSLVLFTTCLEFSWLLDRQSKASHFSLGKESLIVPTEWKGKALASMVLQWLPSADRDSYIDIRSLSLGQNQQGLLVPWLLHLGPNDTFLQDICCK